MFCRSRILRASRSGTTTEGRAELDTLPPKRASRVSHIGPESPRGWMRGRPAATIAFYGPDANRASKVVVGIVASEHAELGEIRDWKLVDEARLRGRRKLRVVNKTGRKV